MSKVSEVKEAQGWTKNNPVCSNCRHYRDTTLITEYKVKIECSLGNFATKKTAWCKKWSPAQ